MSDGQIPAENDARFEVKEGFHSGSQPYPWLYEITLEVGNKTPAVLRIPDGNHTLLCQALLHYADSPKLKKLSSNSKRQLFDSCNAFFTFLSEKNYLEDTEIPKSVLNEFVQWLRDIRKSSTTIYKHSNEIWKALEYFTNSNGSAFPAEIIKRFHLYLGKLNRPKPPKRNAKQSMADLFNTGFTDNELITSLRLVCCWVLMEFQREREQLLAQPEVQAQLNSLKHLPIDAPPFSEGRVVYDSRKEHSATPDEMENHIHLSKTAYATLFKTALSLDDPILLERVATGLPHPFREPLTKSQCTEIIQGYIGKDTVGIGSAHAAGSNTLVKAAFFNINGKKVLHSVNAFNALTYRDLIAPSDVEIFAAQCFFASEREQASNQARQTIKDIENNERGLQAQHAKGRARRNFATGIYPPNSLIETALRGYVGLLEEAQPFLSEDMKQQLFPYQVKHNQTGQIGANNTLSSQFYTLLATTGTAANTKLINDISEADAKPFLTWLQGLIEQNSEYRKERGKVNTENYRLKKQGKPSRSYGVSASRLGLSIDIIGQSYNRASFQSDVTERGSSAPTKSDNENVISALQGHSLETKRNIYDDRAPKSQIDKHFARRVAELMEDDAGKIEQHLKTTKVIDIIEAKRLLGCEDLQDDMQSLLQELDEEVGLSGEIKRGSQTVFIANELTAALMMLQIEHINQEIPLLLNDTPSHSKALDAITHRAYLEEVLKRFPKDIQRAGKNLSETLENIPFAPLI